MDALRHHAGRLAATLAVLGAGAALGGCHELLRVTLGGSDPPTHNPPPAGRAVPATATAAAAGRAFTGSAVGKLAGRVVLKHGFVTSKMKNVRFIGTFAGSPTGPAQAGDEALGPLANSQWHGRFTVIRNRNTGKIKLKGLVLATFDDASAGRACLRVGHRAVRKQNRAKLKKSRSTITILGGEGGAATLRGSAIARLTKLSGDSMRFKGRVRTSQGAARGFSAACTKLEQQFGLTPL